jgi:photosystem II stability/assembly factor-like uncharacterized protein/tetratricopeptide (TPR) repeat protein
MRRSFPALAALALVACPASAAEPRHFEDAPLYAVQFVDRNEGWAVGAEGVVWHSIDGGESWERQPTGVRATLQAVHFLTPYTGYAVGREELPHGGGSAGVVLVTTDGGLKWSRLGTNTLPGLNCVHFFDDRHGVVAGDGTDLHPSGVFSTNDGGKTWMSLPGPRCPSWLAADFQDAQTGALAGAWSRLAILNGGTVGAADIDTLGGRSLRGLKVLGQRAVAVGQGGLVLSSKDSAGRRWGYADLGLPPEVLAACDFAGVSLCNQHTWVVGRPGSVALHSPDAGKRWELLPTGQSLPLHAVHFIDETNGWAVGELGCILATKDGGKTWTPRQRGGQRAAITFVHAAGTGVPLDTVALTGGEGYLTAALQVTTADPASEAPRRATDPQRLREASRLAGGAAGEALWQFPLPQHLIAADRKDLIASWNKLHDDHATDQLLRQLVLELRIWQPEVVVTDGSGSPAEGVVAEAVREAFDQAADPKQFPEQLDTLKLVPWRAKKLYARCEGSGLGCLVQPTDEPHRRLGDTPRDFAAAAVAVLNDTPTSLPNQRSYRLVASVVPGADRQSDLMGGTALAPGGTARRPLPQQDADPEAHAEAERWMRAKRNLQALSQPDWAKLADPGAMLAQIGPVLAKLPPDQGAAAAFALANRYAQAGQWHLAREAFLLMVDRYPADPRSADAYRWLLRYHASSEARRRNELGQFLVITQAEFRQSADTPSKDKPVQANAITAQDHQLAEAVQQQRMIPLSDQASARRWYQGSLEIEPRFAGFGASFATDPAAQFCLQSARRQLGDFDRPKQWYHRFLNDRRGPAGPPGSDPWRDAAAAELWLIERNGQPPKPVALCQQITSRPFLDGKLDDECWKDVPAVELKNAPGTTVAEHATKAWLAYDQEFLYVAVQCKHPADRYVPPVAKRTRDADLSAYDRVSILLDLDRDYQTYFHLQVDQRGAVAEDCWGDKSWNPRWFAAHASDATGWTAELAIPLMELTADAPTIGKAWACNVVRVLPGRGVQAWSLPAEVQPRPEGMGLMMFMAEVKAPLPGEPRRLPPLP